MNTDIISVPKLMFLSAKEAVLAFYALRMNSEDPTFTADQLRFFVNNNVIDKASPSPSTADRLLRMLRQEGKLDYEVLNRRNSLYRAAPLGTTKV